jgi:hypothetical protein
MKKLLNLRLQDIRDGTKEYESKYNYTEEYKKMYKELDNIDPAFYNEEEIVYFRNLEREEKIVETVADK